MEPLELGLGAQQNERQWNGPEVTSILKNHLDGVCGLGLIFKKKLKIKNIKNFKNFKNIKNINVIITRRHMKE